MKKLLLFWIFYGYLDALSQPNYHWYERPDFRIDTMYSKPDTLCEWMHISMRPKGFVIAQKALSVQVNGICVKHLDGTGKPFPVHYRVGWCEGREAVLERLVNERRAKQ